MYTPLTERERHLMKALKNILKLFTKLNGSYTITTISGGRSTLPLSAGGPIHQAADLVKRVDHEAAMAKQEEKA